MISAGQKVAVVTGASQGIGAGVERFGRIDTLINNAGAFIAKPFTGQSAGR